MSMTPEERAEVDDLKKRIEQLEADFLPFKDIRFDPASGGGDVTKGKDNIILRPFPLTAAGSQY